MSARSKQKEVSCLALTFFYDYLKSRGIPRSRLQEGLPYSPEYLDDRLNWIDFQTFLTIEKRMGALFPDDPYCFFNIGRSAGNTAGFGFVRVIVRTVVSPFQVYLRLPGPVNKFLFPFVTITFSRTGRDSMRARYTFDRGYEPSDAFLETVRGILAGLPVNIGVEPARVKVKRVTERVVDYDIVLTNRWLGPMEYVRRVADRASKTATMRLRNLGDATTELNETNLLLQQKVDALTDAKAALDHKVRDLTILNELARVSTSELDLGRLVRRAAAVISGQLGLAPVAVLMAQGDPPRLALGAQAATGPRQARALSRALSPDSELARTVISQGNAAEHEIRGERWRVVPMLDRQRLVGALAVCVKPSAATSHQTDSATRIDPGEDAALFEAMASQLAVAIDNAISYRVINDLRDNLELRVTSRTAELERARQRLEETVLALERSHSARRQFFTNVTHEFKTPLTLILAPLAELEARLRQRGVDDAQEELGHIRRNAVSLLRLVTEVIDFAKLEAQAMGLAIETTDLAEIARDLVVSLKPLADRRKITLGGSWPDGAVGAAVDSKLMQRALANLMANAIKYCDPGDSVQVNVVQADDHLELEVIDTGPGIPAEQQDRIFERFQRVSDGRGRVVEGSGIGLAMVAEIVKLHHGEVQLDSEPGKGARFRINLPGSCIRAVKPDSAALTGRRPNPSNLELETWLGDSLDSIPLPEESFSAPTHNSHASKRVLLVEDNPEMRLFLTRLLSRQHEVIQAHNGAEGLELARRKRPDIVVSDVMMPVLDGFQMCQRLKSEEATRNIPVVLVSAMHDTEASVQGFSVGADDFIVKPFSPPELLARVNSQLRIRTLGRTVMRMERQSTLGLMAAGFAHEVCNPVNVIVNSIDYLRRALDQVPSEHVRRRCDALIAAVEKSGRRVEVVVKDMLTLANHGEQAIALKEIELRAGIESVVAIVSHRLAGRVNIERRYDWNGQIVCYPELINQVVLNLVQNSLDAIGPETDGTVCVTTERIEDRVRIRVGDDGPGISWDARESIFAPFYTTKDPGKGTGMGLAIARDIVSLHNGTLELTTDRPKGAEFVVELPLSMPGQNGALATDPPGDTVPGSGPPRVIPERMGQSRAGADADPWPNVARASLRRA